MIGVDLEQRVLQVLETLVEWWLLRVETGNMENYDLYRLHAEVCQTLAHPTRLHIIDLLREGEATVGELAEKTGLGQANVSQHLALLRNRGIVASRRTGLYVSYRLRNPKMLEAFDILREILLERLADQEQVAKAMRRAR